MMETGIEHPQIIGFGWCGYCETPHPGGRGGLIDCRNDEPLADREAIVRKWNDWMEQHYIDLYRRSVGPPTKGELPLPHHILDARNQFAASFRLLSRKV